ncbi:MAG TPA: adenylyl-sulfate kinase [Firmicutes bacterium]|nr:adenylyl-sulfate kinase [Bacillota bacterium]
MEKGTLIWFTGVPASGKSTIGRGVEKALKERGIKVENLDADEIRANLSPDLGYTPEARDLNTKRLAFMGKILTRNGVCAIVAAVSPLRKHRDRARAMVDQFLEVYVKASLETCKQRDPKGLYKRAERGEVNDIAGWHMPFEEPEKPEVICETEKEDVDTCVRKVIATMEALGFIGKSQQGEQTVAPDEEEKIKERLRGLGYIE